MISVARNSIHATLRWMCYDKHIDKYKCGPVVTTLSDVASPNAEGTSSILLLIYSWYSNIHIRPFLSTMTYTIQLTTHNPLRINAERLHLKNQY